MVEARGYRYRYRNLELLRILIRFRLIPELYKTCT
jgi:hypothetical protein